MKSERETRLFWDHKSKSWKTKRINLAKVPMRYRCPCCGVIMVEPCDREGYRPKIYDYSKVHSFIDKKKKEGYDSREIIYMPEYEQMIDNLPYTLGAANKRDLPSIELGVYGDVCEACWLDGKGRYGIVGKMFKKGLLESGELKLI